MKASERFKRRYVSFALSVEGKPPSASDAKKMIHQHFLTFFGELGVSSLAFKLVGYSAASGKGVLRCAREKVEETIFCMACFCEWEGKPCRLEPLSTSGTIRRV